LVVALPGFLVLVDVGDGLGSGGQEGLVERPTGGGDLFPGGQVPSHLVCPIREDCGSGGGVGVADEVAVLTQALPVPGTGFTTVGGGGDVVEVADRGVTVRGTAFPVP
jgi:hypothetical protein